MVLRAFTVEFSVSWNDVALSQFGPVKAGAPVPVGRFLWARK